MPYKTSDIGNLSGPGTAGRKSQTGRAEKQAGLKTPFGEMLAASISKLKASETNRTDALFGNRPLNSGTAASTVQNSDRDFSESLKVVMGHEGKGYVSRDGRESSKMGILQSTAEEYGYRGDIKDLTSADAEAIYKKIWDKSGASKLPYPLSLVHFDTYVNSPAAARKLLAKSGGDVNAYLDMRAERYSRLASLRPERYAKYQAGWMSRVAHLREMATGYAASAEHASARKV